MMNNLRLTGKIMIVMIISFSTMFVSTVHAQEEDEEIHDEHLKGTAKKLTFYSYAAMSGDAEASYSWLKYRSIQQYNDRGQITEYKMYGRRYLWAKYVHSYRYDQKGQLIWAKYDDSDDFSVNEFEYDKEGNRIKAQTYNGVHELKYVSTLKIKNKKLIEEDIVDVESPSIHPLRRIYIYDSKWNNVLFKIIDRTGKLIVSTTYTYDNKGKISGFTKKDFESNVTTTGSYVYKYFPNGKLKEEVHYSGKYPDTKAVYDIMGRTLEEINYSGDKANDIMADETYKYDKTDVHGNWTQRSRYNNGHRTRLEIREIEY